MDLSARKLFEEVAGYEDAKILGLWEFGTHGKMGRMFFFLGRRKTSGYYGRKLRKGSSNFDADISMAPKDAKDMSKDNHA